MKELNNKTGRSGVEKLSDGTFLRLAVTSLVSVLLCIVCLCSTTWAWFTATVTGDNNTIKSADTCDLTFTVEKDGELVDLTDGSVTLEPDVEYTVTMTLPRDSASGYLLISTATAEYHSDYIERHEDDTARTLTFTLVNGNTENLTVTFTPRWGIYSGESETVDDLLTLK